jgi:drug/metabolite transporter (DMT)-like permease
LAPGAERLDPRPAPQGFASCPAGGGVARKGPIMPAMSVDLDDTRARGKTPLLLGLFAVMALIWGSTWIAMKLGVESVPPIFFAGTRFFAAGSALLMLAWLRGTTRRLSRRELGRLAMMMLLMVVLTYGALFWGIRYVPSGLAAVLDLSLTPVALVGFGIVLGEERWSVSRVAALGFGFAGLAVLFGPQIVTPTDLYGLLGALAIVFSALTYSLGSVLARPLTHSMNAIFLSGITLLPGGIVLIAVALMFEPGALHAAHLAWPAAAWGGWLFLVLLGSLIAFTAFLRLIAAWGPATAGTYAYVSPVIAVLLGVLLLHERVGLRDGIGMLLLLAAAFWSLRAAVPS